MSATIPAAEEWNDDRFDAALFRVFAAGMRRFAKEPTLPPDTRVIIGPRRDHAAEMYTRSALTYLLTLLYVIAWTDEYADGWSRIVLFLLSPLIPIWIWSFLTVGTGVVMDSLEVGRIRFPRIRKRLQTHLFHLLITAVAIVSLRSNPFAAAVGIFWLAILGANAVAAVALRISMPRASR